MQMCLQMCYRCYNLLYGVASLAVLNWLPSLAYVYDLGCVFDYSDLSFLEYLHHGRSPVLASAHPFLHTHQSRQNTSTVN